jgi:protease I
VAPGRGRPARGRTLTPDASTRTDLKRAGADRAAREVVVDQGLVTGRNRGSLDAFCGRILEEFAEGVRAEQRRRA